MNVSVLVPFASDGGWRDRTWRFLRPLWEPVGEVVVGESDPAAWSKGAAVAAAAERASGDVYVIADADVWCADIPDAILRVTGAGGWAMPHRRVLRLNEAATEQVLTGGHGWQFTYADLAEKPYPGMIAGGIVVIGADDYHRCPIDPRFVGWGGEDEAWGEALTGLHGGCWRPARAPLWHLWHPSPGRHRKVRSAANTALRDRYRTARHDREQLVALIEEHRPCRSRGS